LTGDFGVGLRKKARVLLSVVYSEDPAFIEARRIEGVVAMCTAPSGEKMTCRHAMEWYDILFRYWTRLRACDVERNLARLVEVANDPGAVALKGVDGTPQSVVHDNIGPHLADSSLAEPDEGAVGNSYVVLALATMAAGARVPPALAAAFAAAMDVETRRIVALGAPPDCLAVGYRRAVAMEIRRFDFSSGAARCFIREPFGPREAHAMFAIENDMMVPLPDGPPWIPRQTWDARTRDVGVVPRVTVRGIERAALSPWVDTEPILGWDRATPPSPSRYAPPRPADAPSPSLEGVAIFEFRRDPPPTSKQFERHHNRSRRESIGKSCAVCGVGATTDGGKLLRCARCNFVSYCSRKCQKKHWSEHKSRCVSIKDRVKSATDKLKNMGV